MAFHPDKCQVLTTTKKRKPIHYEYSLNGHILQHVTSAKYLGCTLNSKLDWGDHINIICNKTNRTVSFLRRNLNIASTSTKETAYKTLARPTLEYASSAWDPYEKGDIKRLESVQRRAARFVKNNYHNRSSVSDMITDLKWKPLEERRRETRLSMLYKIVHNSVAIDGTKHLIPLNSASTRTTHPLAFQIPYCRTLYRQNSFFPRTIKEWNGLTLEAVSAGTVESFKSQLSKHYI